MGKTLVFLLLFVTVPRGQVYSQWGRVETVTSGNFNDFHPVMDQGGLGIRGTKIGLSAQWLIFERSTSSGGSVIARQFLNGPGAWDTTDYLLSSSISTGEAQYPDISSISDTNVLAVWQQRTGGYWNIFYSKWNGSAWSLPRPITSDTSNNTHPRVTVWSSYSYLVGQRFRFVVAWKSDSTIWVAACDDSGMTMPHVVATSNSDSTQFDLFPGHYTVGILWTIRNDDGTETLCNRFIETLDSLELSAPDTLDFHGEVDKPHVATDLGPLVLFDSRVSDRWRPYGAYIGESFNDTSSAWLDLQSFYGADTTSDLKCMQAWSWPVIIDYWKTSPVISPASFGNGWTVFERIHFGDTALVFVSGGWSSDTVATPGYNRNPSIGSFITSSADTAFGLAVWESNRTGNSQIYARRFILWIDAVTEPPKPQAFTLYQNYPNPFNPTTTITYRLSAVSRVAITVYDVLGRRVKILVDARQSPGEHSVVFDGRGLASGVYFCGLAAGNHASTIKLILIK